MNSGRLILQACVFEDTTKTINIQKDRKHMQDMAYDRISLLIFFYSVHMQLTWNMTHKSIFFTIENWVLCNQCLHLTYSLYQIQTELHFSHFLFYIRFLAARKRKHAFMYISVFICGIIFFLISLFCSHSHLFLLHIFYSVVH